MRRQAVLLCCLAVALAGCNVGRGVPVTIIVTPLNHLNQPVEAKVQIVANQKVVKTIEKTKKVRVKVRVSPGDVYVYARTADRAGFETLFVGPRERGKQYTPGVVLAANAALPREVVPLFFATTRKALTSAADVEYGIERDAKVNYGSTVVSFPYLPPFTPSTTSAVVDLTSFMHNVRTTLDQSSDKSVLVYVHGFNVDYREAAATAATLKQRLRIAGPAIFFTWPSRGDLSLSGYLADSNEAEVAELALRDVLNELTGICASRIVVVAHSMGTRITTRALEQIGCIWHQRTAQASCGSGTPSAKPFAHLVLAAGDVDPDVVKGRLSNINTVVDNVTIYFSANDRATLISASLHSAATAGIDPTPLLGTSADIIDATDVDAGLTGHSYLTTSPILSDMYYLVHEGLRAEARFLRKRPLGTSALYKVEVSGH